jgi:acetyl-CoA synthetase
MERATPEIESLLHEERMFPSPPDFARQAQIRSMEEYHALAAEAEQDYEGYWARHADRELHWHRKWDRVLEWDEPFAKWFVGGQLNASYQCLDRHVATWRRNKAAIIWEGEPGDQRTLTYQQLHCEVSRFASVLSSLGVTQGDRVVIYMPMVPEAAIAMLACARLGAPHSVIFAGFSSEALKDRINDAQAKVVVTADGGWRRGKVVPLKASVDRALESAPSVEHVVVLNRCDSDVSMLPGRDHWWHELGEIACLDFPAVPVDAEHPLFILYTSGTTGKPKGVVHTTAGYMLGVSLTSKWVFDLKEEDVYWCTADIGWVTGHSYVVYGPLSAGATVFMYEGAPMTPQPDRFWELIDKYQISILYTAPTAIRAFIKAGEQWALKHKLDSLRLLGTVGEPINPEAWMWYRQIIGKGRCPIVDTWWQTETGAIMITPLPGATPTKPGTATLPFPGIMVDVVDKEGRSTPPDVGGYLVVKRPWPSMMRTIYGDPERFKKTYWSEIPGMYFAGDGARRDAEGYFWIMGRVDDVINVSGHRLGTMEVESALVSHPLVAEAAVVGRPDSIKGTGVAAFVTLQEGIAPTEALKQELKAHVAAEIGAIARPDDIRFTDALPKTRSGKIMRRLLRDVAAGREAAGDTTALEDYTVLSRLRTSED